MASYLTNLTHNTRADLSRSAIDGLTIGYTNTTNANQKWKFPGVNGQLGMYNIKNEVVGNPVVGVDADEVPDHPAEGYQYQAAVYGGGVKNAFAIHAVGGGIRICFPGIQGGQNPRPDLYWTLQDNLRSTPIRLMPLRTGATAGTQIWTLTDV